LLAITALSTCIRTALYRVGSAGGVQNAMILISKARCSPEAQRSVMMMASRLKHVTGGVRIKSFNSVYIFDCVFNLYIFADLNTIQQKFDVS
jgi:hypothetical protein